MAVETAGKNSTIITLSSAGVYKNKCTCYDYYPTENLNIVSLETKGELEATLRATYWAAILQDSGDTVASTIVTTMDVDKNALITELYIGWCCALLVHYCSDELHG